MSSRTLLASTRVLANEEESIYGHMVNTLSGVCERILNAPNPLGCGIKPASTRTGHSAQMMTGNRYLDFLGSACFIYSNALR